MFLNKQFSTQVLYLHSNDVFMCWFVPTSLQVVQQKNTLVNTMNLMDLGNTFCILSASKNVSFDYFCLAIRALCKLCASTSISSLVIYIDFFI